MSKAGEVISIANSEPTIGVRLLFDILSLVNEVFPIDRDKFQGNHGFHVIADTLVLSIWIPFEHDQHPFHYRNWETVFDLSDVKPDFICRETLEEISQKISTQMNYTRSVTFNRDDTIDCQDSLGRSGHFKKQVRNCQACNVEIVDWVPVEGKDTIGRCLVCRGCFHDPCYAIDTKCRGECHK